MHIHDTHIHLGNFLPLPTPSPKWDSYIIRTMTDSSEPTMCISPRIYTQKNVGKTSHSQCSWHPIKAFLLNMISAPTLCCPLIGHLHSGVCMAFYIQASKCHFEVTLSHRLCHLILPYLPL